MSRVLVLSRNAAIAMGLATADIDVIDCRPDASGTWMCDAADVDVIVVQPDASFDAADAVRKLRELSIGARAVVIQPASADWPSSEDSQRYAVERLALPLSLPLLLHEVRRLAALPAVATSAAESGVSGSTKRDDEAETPDSEEMVEAAREEPTGQELLSEAPRWSDDDDSGLSEGQAAVSTSEAAQGRHDAVDAPLDPLTAPLEALVDDAPALWPSWRPAPPAPPQAVVPLDEVNGDAGQRPLAGESPGSAQHQSSEIVELVSATLARRTDLSSLAEVADIVLTECTERTQAEAGALLCRDGDSWRVAAGIGLRPLEHRYQLDQGHWLVRTLHVEHKAVVVEGTDIARERLHGAPLASWEQVAAVPLGRVEAFVILARREEPFRDTAVELIVRVGAEAESLMEEALRIRELARVLAPFRDDPLA